jgi:putative endonuclease
VDDMGYVYILEFSAPIGDPTNPHGMAQFYIGWTRRAELLYRLAEHRRGRGACITAAAVAAGRELKLACVLVAPRGMERQLKRRKSARKIVNQVRRGVPPHGSRIYLCP